MLLLISVRKNALFLESPYLTSYVCGSTTVAHLGKSGIAQAKWSKMLAPLAIGNILIVGVE
jgi:hypothetical protein